MPKRCLSLCASRWPIRLNAKLPGIPWVFLGGFSLVWDAHHLPNGKLKWRLTICGAIQEIPSCPPTSSKPGLLNKCSLGEHTDQATGHPKKLSCKPILSNSALILWFKEKKPDKYQYSFSYAAPLPDLICANFLEEIIYIFFFLFSVPGAPPILWAMKSSGPWEQVAEISFLCRWHPSTLGKRHPWTFTAKLGSYRFGLVQPNR